MLYTLLPTAAVDSAAPACGMLSVAVIVGKHVLLVVLVPWCFYPMGSCMVVLTAEDMDCWQPQKHPALAHNDMHTAQHSAHVRVFVCSCFTCYI
jgi:hypothetical protein